MNNREIEIAELKETLNDQKKIANIDEYINTTREWATRRAEDMNIEGDRKKKYIHTIIINRLKDHIDIFNGTRSTEAIDGMEPILNRDAPYEHMEESIIKILKKGIYKKQNVIRVKDMNTETIFTMVVPKNSTWIKRRFEVGQSFTIRFERVITRALSR